MKRVIAAILWFMTGWWVGAFVAFALDLNSVLAPVLGFAAVGLFVGDPLRIIWARPAQVVPASATAEAAQEAA